MYIYLLRHGTTEWNARALIQGKNDIPLDGIGVQMAQQTSKRLAGMGISFEKAFSSPLSRALMTARILAPYTEPVTDTRLSELSFGRFEGRNTRQMQSDPDCAFRFFKDRPDLYDTEVRDLIRKDPEGGYETLTDLCLRASSFLRECVEPLALLLPADSNILISGHGALGRALMMHIEERTDLRGFWGSGLSANCGITRISCAAGEEKISYTVQDECFTLYDQSLTKKLGSLL